jgi:hypothetical protein
MGNRPKRISSFCTVLLLAGCLLLFQSVRSQPVDNTSPFNLLIEGKVHYGFFTMHHFEMTPFNSHFPAFEFIIQHATYGRKQWEAVHNYPLFGISGLYSPLGGIDEIGECFAAFPFVSFPLNKNKHRSLNFRLGVGVAYLTNKYHHLNNYQNFAINSHWNAAVNFTFDYRHQVNEFISLTGSLGFMHISSGTTPRRTFGLNFPTAAVGVSSYLTHPKQIRYYKLFPELFKFKYDGKRWFIIESVLFGGRSSKNQTGGESGAFSVQTSVSAMKPFSPKSSLGLGLDARVRQRPLSYTNSTNQGYTVQPGITAVYEMMLSRTSFVFHFGTFLTGFDSKSGPFYTKLAVKRYIQEDIFATLGASMYAGRIDFVGIGVGYSFYMKYY